MKAEKHVLTNTSNENDTLADVLKRIMNWYTHTTKNTMPTQLFNEAFAALDAYSKKEDK